jgi:hypothetical protein
MRGRMTWSALVALASVSGCGDRHPLTPLPTIESRAALITAIRYPAGVNVNDDVTVRFTVVINPCEEFYFAQYRPDGDAMRFSAWSVAAPCVSAIPTTHEVEFFLQGPQRLPRALVFDEPDDVDSVRVLSAKIGS